jgi:hypothetical protein
MTVILVMILGLGFVNLIHGSIVPISATDKRAETKQLQPNNISNNEVNHPRFGSLFSTPMFSDLAKTERFDSENILSPTIESNKIVVLSEPALTRGFGESVDVYGDTMVVGAPSAFNQLGFRTGAAFIFVRINGNWTYQAKLSDPDSLLAANMGNSVSIYGDTVVVGARYGDGRPGNTGLSYVYSRTGSIWTLEQKLFPTDGSVAAAFGASVSIHADTIVVGDTEANSNGAAYVFFRIQGVWTQQAKLLDPLGTPSKQFGYSVSVFNDTIAVGSRYGRLQGINSGIVCLYSNTNNVWLFKQRLSASDGADSDSFGASVAIDGSNLIVGSRDDLDIPNFGSGSAYILIWSNKTGHETLC